MERLRDIAVFIRGMMKASGFKTEEVGYRYPATSLESSILTSIEGVHFMDGTGYIFISGRDYMEYASSDSNLSVAWDGSRPNVKHTLLEIPNEEKYRRDTEQALAAGGGYIQYQWMGRDQTTYVLPYDDYLYIGVASIPEDIKTNTVSDQAYVMASFIAQVISRFIVSNIWKTERYKPFLQAITTAEPRIQLLDGYIDRQSNMAHVPYYPMTVLFE